MEYQKFDTTLTGQYPGDTGYQQCAATFALGSPNDNDYSNAWANDPNGEAVQVQSCDVGIDGFLYVGGDLTFNPKVGVDFYGAMWVVGNIYDNGTGEKSELFFNDKLNVPALNVVLVRQSWKEIPQSKQAW